MLWLLPILCSGLICWSNRRHISAALAPQSRPLQLTAGAVPSTLVLQQGPQHRALLPAAAVPPPPPYAGDVGGSSVLATGTPYGTTTGQIPPYAAAEQRVYDTLAGTPYVTASAPAPVAAPPPAPIAALRCATNACPIRPEPTPWDDTTMGRMPGSFTAPLDYPIYVLSVGPEGWARVLVNHPDEGPVEGWIETRFLGTSAQTSPQTTSVADSASQSGIPATGRRRAVTKQEALARHEQFMQQRAARRRSN